MLVFALLSGCSSDAAPPKRLVDGSPAAAPLVELEASTPQILTKAFRAHVARPGSLLNRCLAASHDRPGRGVAVVRIGTTGTSVTFRTASRTALVGCDGRSTGTAVSSSCGRAYGRLERGRLLDPRLDLAGCTTPNGDPIAFAWFEPRPGAAFVAVEQPGYVEVYPVVARLPVRISSTAGVSEQESRVTFDISEHDATGTLLRSITLDARAAG